MVWVYMTSLVKCSRSSTVSRTYSKNDDASESDDANDGYAYDISHSENLESNKYILKRSSEAMSN